MVTCLARKLKFGGTIIMDAKTNKSKLKAMTAAEQLEAKATTVQNWNCKNNQVVPLSDALTITKEAVEEMHLNMQYYLEYCQENGYVTPQDWIKKYKHF